MTPDQALQAFEHLRLARSASGWAPHKPLLLLLALGRLQQGLPAQSSFTEIEPKLRELLAEFAPASAIATRHLPFWHLQSDPRLWTLQRPADLAAQPLATAPGITRLRKEGVRGGFSSEMERVLRTTPGLIQRAARTVLDAYFPQTLHEDIAAVAGLDLEILAGAGADAAEAARRRRDPAFRARVLQAYEYRCCVCGFDLRVGHTPAGLEAAHIQWHTAGGPDIETNGLCLCALHHKLFDLGAFTVLPSGLVIVFSEQAIASDRGLTGALAHHGRPIHRPQSDRYMPEPQYLAWNYDKVFKKPERQPAS